MRVYAVLILLVMFAVFHGSGSEAEGVANGTNPQQALALAVNPSSVVVKVGESVNVTITVIGPPDMRQVCFSLEGYPGGLEISFTPECTATQVGRGSILTIEVTPAAAPQSFTAIVVGRDSTQTAQAQLKVSIEPAMPYWVPWLGLGLFVLFLCVAVFWNPKLHLRRRSS